MIENYSPGKEIEKFEQVTKFKEVENLNVDVLFNKFTSFLLKVCHAFDLGNSKLQHRSHIKDSIKRDRGFEFIRIPQ